MFCSLGMKAVRMIAVATLVFLSVGGCSDDDSDSIGAPEEDELPTAGPMALAEVRSWAYQIQQLSSDGVIDALAASSYDMLVLEPTRTDWSDGEGERDFNTAAMVARLKNTTAADGVHRKLLIAYIDIGEAEDWRWYWTWSLDWPTADPNPPADWPSYIVTRDPDGWGGNYPVAYWDPAWKDVVIHGTNSASPHGSYDSLIDEVIDSDFDGIYLDWVEAFENKEVIARAQSDGVDPAGEMIAFIGEMRTYARARNRNFLIIQQNASGLIEGHPELPGVIDAVAQEAVWFDGDATDDWNSADGFDSVNDPDLVDYYLGYLAEYAAAGVPVFNCEYALGRAGDAYELSCDEGFIPYATRRALSQLTTTPLLGCE